MIIDCSVITALNVVAGILDECTASIGDLTAIRVKESSIATSTIVSHTLSIREGRTAVNITWVD